MSLDSAGLCHLAEKARCQYKAVFLTPSGAGGSVSPRGTDRPRACPAEMPFLGPPALAPVRSQPPSQASPLTYVPRWPQWNLGRPDQRGGGSPPFPQETAPRPVSPTGLPSSSRLPGATGVRPHRALRGPASAFSHSREIKTVRGHPDLKTSQQSNETNVSRVEPTSVLTRKGVSLVPWALPFG